MKLVDLGEPTSFLDNVYLECAECECKPNETIIEEYRKCSNHECLREQLKKYLGGKISHQDSLVVILKGRSREKVRWKIM